MFLDLRSKLDGMQKHLFAFFFFLFMLNLSAQQKVENLVFEGAGIRGIAYCGALMELNERGILSDVKRVGGTSSGSITACLLSIGYKPEEIYKIIGDTDFGKFNDGGFIFIGGIYRLKHRMGYYKGNKFLRWLENLVEAKTGRKNTTFAQLDSLSETKAEFKQLVVAATSLNHQCAIIFSSSTHPNMRIVDAVRASMAVPLYFEPLIVDAQGQVIKKKEMKPEHHLCVDGGFTANFIIGHFDEIKKDGTRVPAPTLGLRIDSDEQILKDLGDKSLAYQDIVKTKDFIGAFYYITKETMNRQLLTADDWRRTVSISDTNLGPKVKKLKKAEKEQLIAAGRKGVQAYFLR